MIKKICIIAAVCILLVVVLLMVGPLNPSHGSKQDGDSAEAIIDAEVYTVTFYSDDGSVLKTDSVLEGSAAEPPEIPVMTYGNVFRGWTSDFSSVTEDRDVYPEVESVQGKANAFVIPAAYGHQNGTVTVPFQLCGDVCLCGFDLTLEYDTEKLALEEIYNEDGALVYNTETPGQIHMNFVSVNNVEGDVDICWIRFRALSEKGETPITVTINSIYAGDDDEEMYIPEYTLMPGIVYLYQ